MLICVYVDVEVDEQGHIHAYIGVDVYVCARVYAYICGMFPIGHAAHVCMQR